MTETLPEGKCSWIRKTNICGQIDNPNDVCTEATGECSQGFTSHNGKCVKACDEGQAFESPTSNNCIACKSPTQGIKNSNCITCDANQFYNVSLQECVDRSTMLKVSNGAHDDCWMCSTPGALYNCMKIVSNGGSLSQNPKLQAACSVKSNNVDSSEFKLPTVNSVTTAAPETPVYYNNVLITSAFLNNRKVFGAELQDLISNIDNWDESMGQLVVNLGDGTKVIKTKRLKRKTQ